MPLRLSPGEVACKLGGYTEPLVRALTLFAVAGAAAPLVVPGGRAVSAPVHRLPGHNPRPHRLPDAAGLAAAAPASPAGDPAVLRSLWNGKK